MPNDTAAPATATSVRAQVTVTANPSDDAMPWRWTITVDDPRTDHAIAEWFRRLDGIERAVDQLVAVHGWRRAANAVWPTALTSAPVDVALERNENGQRVDRSTKILADAGLTETTAVEPYLAAVAYELERAGVSCKEAFATAEEPRSGGIDITAPHGLYESVQVTWREDEGWYVLFFRDRTNDPMADLSTELPVGFLDEPHKVAAAACVALEHPVSTAPPAWRPPTDYDANAEAADEWWDASPAFDAALAAYTTHPAWQADDSAVPAATARPDVLIIDPFTGCWRSWAGAALAASESEFADDGTRLTSDVRVAGEAFVQDGTLQVVRGVEPVAAWLTCFGDAPVGSKHASDELGCRVCHDTHRYPAPAAMAVLEHRALQVGAAYERRIGAQPGTAITITTELDDDALVATFTLPGPTQRGRLQALQWRSDRGWLVIVAGHVPKDRTLLAKETWQPAEIAAEIQTIADAFA